MLWLTIISLSCTLSLLLISKRYCANQVEFDVPRLLITGKKLFFPPLFQELFKPLKEIHSFDVCLQYSLVIAITGCSRRHEFHIFPNLCLTGTSLVLSCVQTSGISSLRNLRRN